MVWVGYSDLLYQERFTFYLGGIEMMSLKIIESKTINHYFMGLIPYI
tara:strand:+ start:207 stop:347 length:141 start_codon:yes stop_codon:yes gene_type:complete